MANELVSVKKLDSALEEFESKIKEVGVQGIWLIGEFLQAAKRTDKEQL